MLAGMGKSDKKADSGPLSMAELAKIAGVSVASVSRALAGSPLVAPARREHILELAQKHGYVMNTQAQSLRLKRTHAITVVIPCGLEGSQPLTDPFYAEMLVHLAEGITRLGYGMHLLRITPSGTNWLSRAIGANRTDGTIVIGQSTEHEALQDAARHFAPLVVWGGLLPRQAYSVVGTDNVACARMAVEHLLNLGRRRIVFAGDPAISELKLRYDGYLQAMERMPSAKPRLVRVQHLADASHAAIRAAIEEQGDFDAIFAATDVIALGALRAIAAAGLSVPKDIAVVGYDDISLAAHSNPPLTTIRQDIHAGAQALIDAMIRQLRGERPQPFTLTAELIVRESCGAHLQSNAASSSRKPSARAKRSA